MSPTPHSRTTVPPSDYAPLFAALGDETRLALVGHLSRGRPYSIAQLTSRTKLTRQAVTKHLRVLEGAGVVSCKRSGRQSLYALDPTPLVEVAEYLVFVSEQWDQALSRLKQLVEP